MPDPQFKTFADFWPHYLNEHSKPATRYLHCLGNLAAMAILIFTIAAGTGGYFP